MDGLRKVEKPVAYPIPDNIGADEIIVLPERINDKGVALYVESSMELYKELRDHEGSQVSYLNTIGGRKWVDRLGLSDETIISLILSVPLGLLVNMTWDAIKKFASERKESKNVRIKITIANRDSDPAWTWYEFEGSPKEVIELADRITNGQEKTPPKD